jgi:hypothetical protein
MGYSEIRDALSLLTPYEVPSLTKVRIGNKTGDGGYAMADHFRPGQKVYSYGISTEISFDLAMAERGLQIFMYDHTIQGLPSSHPNFHFFRQGLGTADQPEQSLYMLKTHIDTNGHNDNDMILKMDIEGAEWSVLDQIDPVILGRFEQITMEIHHLTQLKDANYRAIFQRVFTKINSLFHIIHVHANNVAPVYIVEGNPITALMEITCLRKDIGPVAPWRSFIPTALDAPNTPNPDIVLSRFRLIDQRLDF